jgi:hypothetical protein
MQAVLRAFELKGRDSAAAKAPAAPPHSAGALRAMNAINAAANATVQQLIDQANQTQLQSTAVASETLASTDVVARSHAEGSAESLATTHTAGQTPDTKSQTHPRRL